jgi:hypothetical protein
VVQVHCDVEYVARVTNLKPLTEKVAQKLTDCLAGARVFDARHIPGGISSVPCRQHRQSVT